MSLLVESFGGFFI